MFGLASFDIRERFITDGPEDGGIDGYYIDKDTKRIYLIQSNFRNTDCNFERKEISESELLAMDIDNITAGHTKNAAGVLYNGTILGLIRELAALEGIARYAYDDRSSTTAAANPKINR